MTNLTYILTTFLLLTGCEKEMVDLRLPPPNSNENAKGQGDPDNSDQIAEPSSSPSISQTASQDTNDEDGAVEVLGPSVLGWDGDSFKGDGDLDIIAID